MLQIINDLSGRAVVIALLIQNYMQARNVVVLCIFHRGQMLQDTLVWT